MKSFVGPIIADDNDGNDIPDEGWNGIIDEVFILSLSWNYPEFGMSQCTDP
ncbi:MAG: hypothetical protein ACE5KT_02890 [Methanosarcinales archaeon]